MRSVFSAIIIREVFNMNLNDSGSLIRSLRKAKGITQKDVADILGIQPKTVSKWETGNGFPDVSYISELADVLGVSERILLSGNLKRNAAEAGNMKKTRFFVCPHCKSISQCSGNQQVICCGKPLSPLAACAADSAHLPHISETENDFFIALNHEMTKEHYIAFAAYVTFDRVLTVKLYPEQDSALRFSKMYGGKLYLYCTEHGLFEFSVKRTAPRRKRDFEPASMTAQMSAFARAYHAENTAPPIFCDKFARKLFSDSEYSMIKRFILTSGKNISEYVNTYLAPTPLARARFCTEALQNAIKSGAEQLVILGSGLDMTGFSEEYKNISVFELDRSDVTEDKKRRLERAGIDIPENIHLVPCRLGEDSLSETLLSSGYDKSKKTFFSCMGLFYYMTPEEISDLFNELSEISADGSEAAFDFGDAHLFSSNIPRVSEMRAMAEKSGEPMKSCFGYNELEQMLEKHGFLIYEFLNRDNIQKRYFEGSALSAFENINLALAVLKNG